MTKEYMRHGSVALPWWTSSQYDYGIKVEKYPEFQELLPKYQSVLTSFSMNDFDNRLHKVTGSAGAKYGEIHLEEMFRSGYKNSDSSLHLEKLLDNRNSGIYKVMESNLSSYLHEFTHTVETQLSDEDDYGLHQASMQYYLDHGASNNEFLYMCDYLRGEFIADGKKVGIPYKFWTGEYTKE